ncbi:MAG: hypothetical protein ACODAB_03560 [Gemmatimonadota bacterium]
MSEEGRLQERLDRAERRVRWLTAGLLACGLAVVLGAAQAAAPPPPQDVIRARGLVIVDSAGRERVVVGAPMADASEDARLAETTGVTVLDAEGRLAASIGANNPLIRPDGTPGERRGTASGMTFYDPRTGQERGGIGAFDDGRANMCIDWASAEREAICVAVWSDDQYGAVILNGTPHETSIYDRVVLYVGSDGTGRIKAFGGNDRRDGVSIDVGRGTPEVTVFDSTGTPSANLVEAE